jgi:hypothetical protein
MLLVAAAFAVSLGALSVAGITAWFRCGGGEDCSSDLALGILGAAPAALLLVVVLLLLRKEASSAIGARIVLVVTLAVAALPLAAFVVRDVQTLAIMAVLFAGLVALALVDDLGWTQRPSDRHSLARPATAVLNEAPVPRLSGLLEELIEAQDELAAIIRAVRALLPDPPMAIRDGRLARPGAPAGAPVIDASVVLVFAAVRDFDEFVAMYDALRGLPAVSDIAVRYFDTNCGLMQISLASTLLPPVLIEVLKHTSTSVAALPPAQPRL